MKLIYILILTSISVLGYSQSWEIPNWDIVDEEFTRIYDIANHESTLYLTGVHKGEIFFFASSDDGGNSWNEVVLNNYISVDSGIPITVGFFNAEQGIIGIKGNNTKQYLRTEDGGLTWENYTIEIDANCAYSPQPWKIIIANDTTAIIQNFQSGNYIITRDTGNSWKCNYDFTTSWLPKFTVLNEHTFFTFDFSGLYKSNDGGITWTTALDVRDLSTYSMLDEENGFALSYYNANEDKNPRLYATKDGWNTYDMFILSSLNDKVIEVIAPVNSEEIYFFEYDSIHYSNDGGNTASFFQIPHFAQPAKAELINDQWYVFGRDLARYNPEGVITGDTKQSEFEDVFIYPNPVTNSIIRLNTNLYSSYEIYSTKGKLIENGTIENGKVKVTSTIKGLYILSVQNRNSFEQKTFKILMQ